MKALPVKEYFADACAVQVLQAPTTVVSGCNIYSGCNMFICFTRVHAPSSTATFSCQFARMSTQSHTTH
jgi:hypothetical protein